MNIVERFGQGNWAEKNDLLTVSEVSAILAVSKMTVYRMIHSGELEHVQVDGSYRVVGESLRCCLMRESFDSSSRSRRAI
jgi:excisionase family DNA binding protein